MDREQIKNNDEIQTEIFSNKERINHLEEKLQVLRELAGDNQ